MAKTNGKKPSSPKDPYKGLGPAARSARQFPRRTAVPARPLSPEDQRYRGTLGMMGRAIRIRHGQGLD